MRRRATPAGEAPIVLITFPDYDTEHPELGGALTAAGCVMRIAPKRGQRTPAELFALCADASGAIVSTDPFTAEVLQDSPALQIIARVGVGTDSIDVAAATDLGVAIATTLGANEDTVADHAIAMMLALLRRVTENDAGVRRGEWNRTGVHAPKQLSGCTVGLVGYGNIGRRVACRLSGFDVELLVADPALEGSDSPRSVPLAELVASADIVSLHCPLIPETRHLIDEETLRRMQPHALLVNTCRGGVVDEGALFRALRDGEIAGAALDVFEAEPPHDSPLMDLPNVVVSPHVAGISTTSVAEMTRRSTVSVLDVLARHVPADLANQAVLRRWQDT